MAVTPDSPLQATTDREVQHARVLRIALGTALCLLVSQMLGWSLSFLAPVITLFVLAMPKPSPGLVGGIKLFLAVVLASYSGFALLPLLASWG